jgi:hypothetical protein
MGFFPLILFTTAREIGLGTGIVKKSPLECTGTQFYQTASVPVLGFT